MKNISKFFLVILYIYAIQVEKLLKLVWYYYFEINFYKEKILILYFSESRDAKNLDLEKIKITFA